MGDTRNLYNRIRPRKFEDMYRTSTFLDNIVSRVSKALKGQPGLSHVYMFYSEEPGLGKAQPYSSKVLTPSGWKSMGEIETGDKVIGADGKECCVTGVYEQGVLEAVKVTFQDKSTTRCCREHLWNIQRKYERTKNKNVWKTVVTKDLIDNLKLSNGGRRYSIPLVKAINFSEKALPIPAYTMGVLLGDGGIHEDSLILSNENEFIRKAVSSKLPKELSLKPVALGTEDYRISVSNGMKRDNTGSFISTNPYISSLRVMGLTGKRSYEKFIPDIYKLGSIEQRIALLQGLMDTDGEINKDGSAVQYSTSSKQLSKDMVDVVQSLGGICRTRKKYPWFTYKGEKKKGRTSYIVNISLPNDIIPFKENERRLSRVVPRTKYLPTKRMDSIVPDGRDKMKCISVSNNDGLYITDDYIVTHNTTSARILASVLNPSISEEERDMLFSGEHNPVCFHINGGEKRKIADIRELIDHAEGLKESLWDYNYVFIIDEVHKLTDDSVDALLATIENYPENTYFISTTTDISKMRKPKSPQEMFLSRCETHQFRPLSKAETTRLLLDICRGMKYNVLEDRIVDQIYTESDGRPRKAVVLLSQYVETGKVGIIEEDEVGVHPHFKKLLELYVKVVNGTKVTWANNFVSHIFRMLNEHNAEDARIKMMQRLFYVVMDQRQGIGLRVATLYTVMGKVLRDPVVPPQKSDLVSRLYSLYLEALKIHTESKE